MPSEKHLKRGAVPPTLQLPPLQALVILHHVTKFKEEAIDADNTHKRLIDKLNKTAFGRVRTEVIESGLYFCTMADENGEFWHPFELTYPQFIRSLLPGDLTFDTYYNFIVPKEKRV